ncbi:MAG: GAF domain-containing protein [Myxococcota bacterium]
MKAAPIPDNEAARIAALHALELLDTDPDERFDRVTRAARTLLGVPMALVSLIDSDRQWFKSKCGLDADQTGRDVSFCGHVVANNQLLVVPDARLDDRFATNPLVTGPPHVRFYAGHPVWSEDGLPLGTLCVIDVQPRSLGVSGTGTLARLAAMVTQELQQSGRSETVHEATGLSNRAGFVRLADEALAGAHALGQPASMLRLDVADEGWSTEERDAVDREVGRLIRVFTRERDVGVRLAEGRFGILLLDCVDGGEQAERVRFALRGCQQRLGLAAPPAVTLGWASSDKSGAATAASLLQGADTRLRQAQLGRPELGGDVGAPKNRAHYA